MITKICRYCRNSFETKANKYKFCSRACYLSYDDETWFKKGHKFVGNKGEKHQWWKGNKVGYEGLHTWVRKMLGSATKCKNCGITKDKARIEWSNNDHKYKRNLIDWTSLCCKCHRQYEKVHIKVAYRYVK